MPSRSPLHGNFGQNLLGFLLRPGMIELALGLSYSVRVLEMAVWPGAEYVERKVQLINHHTRIVAFRNSLNDRNDNAPFPGDPYCLRPVI